MPDLQNLNSKLPPEQQAIRDKCFHPSGRFVEFPKKDVEGSIPERFEKIVQWYPDRIAIKRETEQITYDELNKAANRLAHAIRRQRLNRQEPAVLFFESSISLIVGYMATLKAGMIALHVDPSASSDRIKLLMTESHTRLIVTNSTNYGLAREWTTFGTQLINIDGFDSGLTVDNVKLPIAADDLAHIAYTSGSTGKAKGAAKTHRFSLHSAMDDTNTYRICADDRVAVLGSVAIGKPILNTLLNGAAQYPLDRRDDSLPHLADWLARNDITILVCSPSAFRNLLSDLSGREICPTLRLIRLGSEPLYRSDVELYKKHFNSNCVLVHSYGSNETNTICDYFITKDLDIIGHRVPVGYPRNNVEVFVVDDSGDKVLIHQTGEIVVKSQFLSSGYWQQAKLTSDRFRDSSITPDEREYFTGDIGCLSEDGCLEHLGRNDSIVKLRGVGVDVSEIEARLLRHDGVREAIVLPKEVRPGEVIFVAYIVPRTALLPTAANLRAFLVDSLPDYMIPCDVITLDHFPLTATGKVDRRALPDPGRSRPDLTVVYVAPGTPVERELARIWTEVLTLDRIGIHDNFFELGGHSLAALRIISRVIQALKLELPVKALFESPTIAKMAATIEQSRTKPAKDVEVARMLSEVETMTDEEAEAAVKLLVREAKS